jgi:hypothetical protein
MVWNFPVPAMTIKRLISQRIFWKLLGLGAALGLLGCSSISEHSHAYLTAPHVSPTDPNKVAILPAEPVRAKDRLGEVRLSVMGEPARADIERRLREGAARLGADAVFLVYDRVHVFPVVYAGWYGPTGIVEDTRREIVGVAVKYR